MQIKTIVITGASRGIGKAILDLAVQKKQLKILALTRNAGKLEKEFSQNHHNKPVILEFDFENNLTSLNHLIERIKSETSHVDVVINNAADILMKPFGNFSQNDLERLYRINVIAPFMFTQALLPFMEKASGGAHVVNIGSMGGFQGSVKFPGLSVYASTKAALANLSEGLAEELKQKNISVNCLALGAVKTEMLKAAFPGYEGGVSPHNMASFILDFALSANGVFNGKILPVSNSTP